MSLYLVDSARNGKVRRHTAGSLRQAMLFAQEEIEQGSECVTVEVRDRMPDDVPVLDETQADLFDEPASSSARCAIRGGL